MSAQYGQSLRYDKRRSHRFFGRAIKFVCDKHDLTSSQATYPAKSSGI